jgi:hypothetical protein
MNSIWIKEELPDQWKEPIVLPIYKMGDKTAQLLRDVTATNIILSRLNPYIYEVTGDYQCGFRRNRSTTDQIFCIHQILEKKWEFSETVRQLFIDLKKAYDLVRREVSYSIFIEFGVPMNLLRLIKMCLNEMFSKVCIGKHLFDTFAIQNGLKQGDPLVLLLFNFALQYAIRKACENQVGVKFNGTLQL